MTADAARARQDEAERASRAEDTREREVAEAERPRQQAVAARAMQEEDVHWQRLEASDIATWTVDDVGLWLTRVGLSGLQPAFRQHQVSGKALVRLTPAVYADVGITTVGQKLEFEEEHGRLLAQQQRLAPGAATGPAAAPSPAPVPASSSGYDTIRGTPPKWQVARGEVEMGEFLGQGSFGGVYRARFRGSTVAAKVAKPRLTQAHKDAMAREAEVMQALPGHPNVVTFFGACLDEQGVVILLELCDGGSLDEYVHHTPTLGAAERRALLHGVAAGLSHLEVNAYVHRDVALRNVLLRRTGGGHVPVVADFGLSRELAEAAAARTMTAQAAMPYRGTAPEVFAARRHSSKSDVWAFGVLAWELMTGTPLFGPAYSDEQVAAMLLGFRKLPFEADPSLWVGFRDARAAALVKSLLARSPADRPTAAAVASASRR